MIELLDEDAPTCDVCGEEMQWEECGECFDGVLTDFDEDAEEYEEVCDTCGGFGGWWYCENRFQHKQYVSLK